MTKHAKAESTSAVRTAVHHEPDVPVSEAAQRLFRENSHRALHGLTCDYREGVLTIRGRLPSFYLKQLAQTLARHIDGVKRIVNHVEVT